MSFWLCYSFWSWISFLSTVSLIFVISFLLYWIINWIFFSMIINICSIYFVLLGFGLFVKLGWFGPLRFYSSIRILSPSFSRFLIFVCRSVIYLEMVSISSFSGWFLIFFYELWPLDVDGLILMDWEVYFLISFFGAGS